MTITLRSIQNLIGNSGRDLRMMFRAARDYPRFVWNSVETEDALRAVRARLRERERNFLSLLEERIYGYPKSPYLPLLRSAG